MELAVAYSKVFADFGLVAGAMIVLLAFTVGTGAWMLWRVNPMLAKISENNLIIAKAQEATAFNLKAAADTMQAMSITFATHDQRAAMMHDTCKDHGGLICDTKDLFVEYHRETMTKLTEIHAELKALAKAG